MQSVDGRRRGWHRRRENLHQTPQPRVDAAKAKRILQQRVRNPTGTPLPYLPLQVRVSGTRADVVQYAVVAPLPRRRG